MPFTTLVSFQIREENNDMDEWLSVWHQRGVGARTSPAVLPVDRVARLSATVTACAAVPLSPPAAAWLLPASALLLRRLTRCLGATQTRSWASLARRATAR